MRNLLIQKDLGEQRDDWMISLQEYDLEIKPAKIIRGKGLFNLIVESRDLKEKEEG